METFRSLGWNPRWKPRTFQSGDAVLSGPRNARSFLTGLQPWLTSWRDPREHSPCPFRLFFLGHPDRSGQYFPPLANASAGRVVEGSWLDLKPGQGRWQHQVVAGIHTGASSGHDITCPESCRDRARSRDFRNKKILRLLGGSPGNWPIPIATTLDEVE